VARNRCVPLTLEQIAYCLYQVHGLPPGQEALIAGADYRGWRLLRTIDGRCDEDWTGYYETAEAALRHLETLVNAG